MHLPVLVRASPTVALAVLAAFSVCPTAFAQERDAPTVLTIHWGPEDFPGTSVLDAAIQKALRADLDAAVNYYAEYLESETFPVESASLALRDYIRQKFAGRRIDLVIANTTPALQFAVRHRIELFPEVPIVFVAGSIPDVMVHRTVAGVTGVLSDVAFAETLEVALKLHPSVQRVFVVAQAPGVEGYDERVRAALARFSRQVKLSYIREKSVSRLIAAIKAVPPQSLILYIRYTPETGRVIYSPEVAHLVAQASAVPVYGTTDLYMGTGVVGGMMRGSRATGTRVGEIARQVLNGTRPEDIPIESVGLVPTFDWRQLRHWDIDPSALPRGADIQFRTPTAWEAYRWYLLAIAIVVALQLLLIMGLLTQRARRRHAEVTIRTREATLRTSYKRIRHMAGRLINAQEAARAGIARDLHDDVCQQLVNVSMGISSLKGSLGNIQDTDTQQAFAELERDTVGMFDGIRRLSHDLHPATLRLLGLAPALKAHCLEFAKRHNVQVSFRIEGDLGPLHENAAICFFRIAQEGLRNGLVHGDARRFAVSLARAGEVVELTVTDEGRGFDLEAALQDGGGLGLVSMEERAHVVGAHVEIVTALQQGTTIRVRGPVEPSQSVRPSGAALRADATAAERTPAVG